MKDWVEGWSQDAPAPALESKRDYLRFFNGSFPDFISDFQRQFWESCELGASVLRGSRIVDGMARHRLCSEVSIRKGASSLEGGRMFT